MRSVGAPWASPREQYAFIHDALLEATKTGGVTEVEAQVLADHLEKLDCPVVLRFGGKKTKKEEEEDEEEKSLLERQFEVSFLFFIFI